MSIARTDVQLFFTYLGHNVDNKGIKCFKCDKPLYYKSSLYQCDNLHKYSYRDIIFKYSLHLENIKDELGNIGACGLQSVDFG